MDTTDNVILVYSLIKFTVMPRFTLCVVTCMHIFNNDFLDSLTLRMVPIGCPETSVRIDHYSLLNNPEERSSHLIWTFSI